MAPILVFFVSFIQVWLTGIITRLQKARLKLASQRASQISEIVNGIKVIKFNAWEKFIIEKVGKIRLKERSIVYKLFVASNFLKVLEILVPYILTLVCLWMYQSYVEELTVTKVFTILSIL